MDNISLEAIQNVTDLTYIGISKNLDFMINNSDIMYENATVNITNVCPNISWDYFTLWPLIGFVSVAVVGTFLCLFGYRFLRASVFIISVIIFSGLIYVVCCEVVASSLPPLVIAGSSLLSGILGGSLSILLLSCFGSRVVSISAGVTIVTYLLLVLRIGFQFPLPVAATASESLGLYGAANHVRDNHTSEYFFSRRSSSTEKSLDWIDVFPAVVSLVSMAIGGCVMLVASFLRPKAALVLSTSVIGSAMLGLTADFFTDRVMVLSRVSLDCLAVKVTLVEDLCHLGQCCCCWVGWLVVGIVPVLVLLSTVVQWCCTSSRVEHELDKLGLVSCSPCGSARQTGVPVLMEPSEKYRHLYRIRRTNGDIISRTHMEAIEVRRSNPSLMLTTARSNSDVVTTTDDDATLVLTQTLEE